MELSKEELRDMYYSMKNKELCKKLGISNVTLIALLKRSGIKLKGPGNRTERYKITIKD